MPQCCGKNGERVSSNCKVDLLRRRTQGEDAEHGLFVAWMAIREVAHDGLFKKVILWLVVMMSKESLGERQYICFWQQ